MPRTPAVPDGPLSDARFLTVSEIADVLRVSRMTVYRLVEGGDLPAVTVGRSVRVPEAALRDYLEQHVVGSGTDG